MLMTVPHEPSAVQRAWCDLASGLRRALAARLADINRISVTDLGDYLDAFHTAMTLELCAETYDSRVEMELNNFPGRDPDD
jgi:hypothetical protein